MQTKNHLSVYRCSMMVNCLSLHSCLRFSWQVCINIARCTCSQRGVLALIFIYATLTFVDFGWFYNSIETPASVPSGPRLTCEFCGKSDLIHNFARSKRFCSVTCSKRFSAYSQRKQSENGSPGKFGFQLSKGLKRPYPTMGSTSNQVCIKIIQVVFCRP